MPTVTFALDRSARSLDADGRLHVERSHISKVAVNPYYGREIPGFEALGLEPNKIYRLLRDPVELERGAATFARLPILKKHIPLTVANVAEDEELKKLIVGAIGSNIIFDAPYLDADICVWDAAAIAGIETKQVEELSCGYRYIPVMEPGEFEGQPYDGRMTEIRGNHLALVEVGRAGADVVVADHNPFTRKPAMKMSKLGKALFAALCAASPVLAADSALPALVGNANRKTFDRKEIKGKILALDADLNPETVDSVVDSLLDVEQDPKPQATPAAAADESPADKLRSLLAGKVDEETLTAACSLLTAPAPAAADSTEGAAKPEDVKAAMDGMRKELREASEAAREVRATVGDVAMDSAAEIYGFALDHLKVDRAGVEGAPALRALFRVASKTQTTTAPVVALDSAGLATRFPGASRFRSA